MYDAHVDSTFRNVIDFISKLYRYLQSKFGVTLDSAILPQVKEIIKTVFKIVKEVIFVF
jgi:hypothetical protein